jgi:hypothetical protein
VNGENLEWKSFFKKNSFAFLKKLVTPIHHCSKKMMENFPSHFPTPIKISAHNKLQQNPEINAATDTNNFSKIHKRLGLRMRSELKSHNDTVGKLDFPFDNEFFIQETFALLCRAVSLLYELLEKS